MRAAVPSLVLLLSVGCAAGPGGPPATDCSPGAIWRAVSTGGTTACEATDDAQRSAQFLAERHAELAARLAAYEALGATGGLTGPQQLERVDMIRDLEQIRGVAIVRGWVDPADVGAQGVQKQ